MRSALRYKTGLSLLFLLLQGIQPGVYAQGLPGTPPPRHNLPPSYNPDTLTNYDQFIASVPRTEAQTASVALASITIALHRAKQSAEQTLCGGRWAPRGDLLRRQGPTLASNPPAATKTAASWRYNALRQASPLACDQISRAEFFMEMSRHLPAWIQIRPAGQLSAYRQGKNILLNPQTVAVR
ncbi:MAG TPA: hypothetical protein ENJ80_06910 [Gammaproteobacteria bacterium]|nr:hypothetical protein [Gammaproteobacteria bacterium]